MMQTDVVEEKISQTVPLNEWTSRMERHEQVLSDILDPYLEKRSKQEKDPVLDFLFQYYKFRPSHLRRWSPGVDVVLEHNGKTNRLPEVSELTVEPETAFLDPALFPEKRLRATRWIHELLVKTNASKPFFGCFGMHEWAMVYRAEGVRHNQVPLRFSDDRIAEIVESRPVLCTHFDAYRFFTDAARPLNKHDLTRDIFQDMEQPGCIHSNMDIYKWAYKLYPWISSDLIREAFLLAVDARTFDMKASPYDLRDRGLEPIKIETEEGRKVYLKHQTEIWERGLPVRKKLIEAYHKLISLVG
ncbi:3-methyladenine DNA glycosylase [Rhodohalobacter sp. SW132]|uniref:3-methyladenine DNA glycosylase n=1 Tax=Rhodohalobacter sp. SW132 TaxID=2293433 RepID=UPI0018F47E2A|nr:3-methyladenine DNA glycosylase [Rhodohalobacter sp. SW132]